MTSRLSDRRKQAIASTSFGLTNFFYWLNVGGHELLRYSDAFVDKIETLLSI